jgi:hypothetical protein
MWNHRNLDDPIQANIESIIKKHVAEYGYGTRREDQTIEIEKSNLFKTVHFIDGGVEHKMTKSDLIEAWRSHATLERQAKNKFHMVIDKISSYVESLDQDSISVPYTTRMWAAQLH